MKILLYLILSLFNIKLCDSINITNDIIFLIDSSPSVINNNDCDHQKLVRTFTSEVVDNTSDYNIRYKSIQYNLQAKVDYDFTYNNTIAYNNMLNHKFYINAPTVISTGLNKIIDSYSNYNNFTHNILLLIISDGDTLNKNNAIYSLAKYPFNNKNTKIILIITKTNNNGNNLLFEIFKNNTKKKLNCNNIPSINNIINEKFNKLIVSSSSSISSTTVSTMSTRTTVNTTVPIITKKNITKSNTITTTTLATYTSNSTFITNAISSSMYTTTSISSFSSFINNNLKNISNKNNNKLLENNNNINTIHIIILYIIIVLLFLHSIYIHIKYNPKKYINNLNKNNDIDIDLKNIDNKNNIDTNRNNRNITNETYMMIN